MKYYALDREDKKLLDAGEEITIATTDVVNAQSKEEAAEKWIKHIRKELRIPIIMESFLKSFVFVPETDIKNPENIDIIENLPTGE